MDTFWYICITAWYSAAIWINQSYATRTWISKSQNTDWKSFQSDPCNVMSLILQRLVMQNIITCIIGKNIKFKSVVISEEEKWYVIREGSTYVSF